MAMRHTIRRHTRRPMDGTYLSARIGRPGGGGEGRMFNVMTHADDEFLAHRFDIHERPAKGQPELAAAIPVEAKAKVEKAMRCANVELHALEDRRDLGTLKVQRPL